MTTFDDAAIHKLIVEIQSYREAIRRVLEAWVGATRSHSPASSGWDVYGGGNGRVLDLR